MCPARAGHHLAQRRCEEHLHTGRTGCAHGVLDADVDLFERIGDHLGEESDRADGQGERTGGRTQSGDDDERDADDDVRDRTDRHDDGAERAGHDAVPHDVVRAQQAHGDRHDEPQQRAGQAHLDGLDHRLEQLAPDAGRLRREVHSEGLEAFRQAPRELPQLDA